MAFLQRVKTNIPIIIVDPWIINVSLEGIKKHIAREQNHKFNSKDPEFIALKQAKIDKLAAIRYQLKLFKKALIYSSFRINVLSNKNKKAFD